MGQVIHRCMLYRLGPPCLHALWSKRIERRRTLSVREPKQIVSKRQTLNMMTIEKVTKCYSLKTGRVSDIYGSISISSVDSYGLKR